MSLGTVVWLTGRPSSGKSTFARRLQKRLRDKGRTGSVVLDGDEVRAALVPNPGYSPEERDSFYATLARMADVLARQELIVIVAATTNRRSFRDRARALTPRFIEVWLDVPRDECARRDSKGLYALAARGEVAALPGIGVEYEEPRRAEVHAQGGEDDAALDQVLGLLAASTSDHA